MEQLTREEWKKIFDESKRLYRESLVNLAVFGNTWKLAEEKLHAFELVEKKK